MAELVREIEEVDLPKLKELLKEVFDDPDWTDIKRLGGMTNHSYRITRADGQEYLVRIPGEGTEEMINRLDERKSTELACKLGIDSPLLYFGDDGRKVMKFIHDPQEMSEEVMRKQELMEYRRRTIANYDENYKGLNKQFYQREWITGIAADYGKKVLFTEVDNPQYIKGKYLFNCYIL